MVESLQQKFPTVPKSQLKTKVREVSDFVDNRWQVSDVFPNFAIPMLRMRISPC